jgi:hypothetical protein
MRSRNAKKAATAETVNGPLKTNRLGSAVSDGNKHKPKRGQLIDRYGHLHSEAIFKN